LAQAGQAQEQCPSSVFPGAMDFSRVAKACAAAAACALGARGAGAFILPAGTTGTPQLGTVTRAAAAAEGAAPRGGAGSWGAVGAGLAIGAHAGLAAALYGRSARKAEAEAATKVKETKVLKYVETAKDERLFEQVFHNYSTEYLKGPMYWHEDKLQGTLPDYPGTPMFKNGKMTSNPLGNLKNFSSNELAFLSMLFFAIGAYGNIEFLFLDPQWARVDNGENFNVAYIVESLFLPFSFFMHISCYIQRKNGK